MLVLPLVATEPLLLVPLCFSCVEKQLFMQLGYFGLSDNLLVGSLPDAWSNLSRVSPTIELA